MRSWGFAVVLVLAGCTDTGAHLTLKAPGGPSSAATFRVVLATPDVVPTVKGQRVRIDSFATQAVSYYLQRTVAGTSDDRIDAVDGFTLRIAPDRAVTDTQFIPFVIMYDAAGSIVGIGTYHAGTPTPAPILVVRDEIDKYTIDVEAAKQVDDRTAPAPGQVQVVECATNGTTFTSGVVWRPAGGGELRLMFPDDGGMDATGRALDLDCDGHAVTPESSHDDCDDSRDWFHRGAEDVCDGYDTNCDGARAIATSCTPNPTCIDPATNQPSSGVDLCDDQTATDFGCHLSATCQCLTGTGCASCFMQYTSGSTSTSIKPCQPATGMLSTSGRCSSTAPCRVEVASVSNGWNVEVATTSGGSFGSSATNVTDSFAIRAGREEGPSYEVMLGNSSTVADIALAFVTPTATLYVPVRLAIADSGAQSVCPTEPVLSCSP